MRRYLGSEWIRLARITDQSRRLNLAATRHLEAVLDDFERTFPQVFLAVYVGPLPTEITLSGFGFWLLNHGAFETHLSAKRNDFGIVLVIDPLRHSASWTVGYALEAVLPEAALTAILKSLRGRLGRANLAGAIEKGVRRLKKTLRAAATRQPVELPTAPPTGDLSLLGLEALRHQHRPHRHETHPFHN
jgi:uncharacterized membrane protein YgcG